MFDIGATMVGAIVQTYKANSFVKKGEEKGYFLFGGSTCILIFEKGKVIIDKDIIENTQNKIETRIYIIWIIYVKRRLYNAWPILFVRLSKMIKKN